MKKAVIPALYKQRELSLMTFQAKANALIVVDNEVETKQEKNDTKGNEEIAYNNAYQDFVYGLF